MISFRFAPLAIALSAANTHGVAGYEVLLRQNVPEPCGFCALISASTSSRLAIARAPTFVQHKAA
ncbi:MAG: hypothetical protein WA713_13855, partial [Candidatus Acidiferrales bacterium]